LVGSGNVPLPIAEDVVIGNASRWRFKFSKTYVTSRKDLTKLIFLKSRTGRNYR
jgi:hypothetical protein